MVKGPVCSNWGEVGGSGSSGCASGSIPSGSWFKHLKKTKPWKYYKKIQELCCNFRTGLTFVFNKIATVLYKQAGEMKINLVQRCPRRLKRCRGKYKENKKNILGEEIMWTKIQTSQEIQYAIAMERPRWLKCSFPEVVGKWVKWVENLGPINGKLWGNCSSQIKHWRQPKDLSGSSI